MTDTTQFTAGDLICGSAHGTWTPRQEVLCMIDTIKEMENSPAMPERHVDLANMYRDLATMNDDEIDPTDWVDEFNHEMEEYGVFAPFCSAWYEDNELRVTANVENMKEGATPWSDELHHDLERNVDTNPENDDYVYEVNDHGNVTLFAWKDGEWKVEWAVV